MCVNSGGCNQTGRAETGMRPSQNLQQKSLVGAVGVRNEAPVGTRPQVRLGLLCPLDEADWFLVQRCVDVWQLTLTCDWIPQDPATTPENTQHPPGAHGRSSPRCRRLGGLTCAPDARSQLGFHRCRLRLRPPAGDRDRVEDGWVL